MAERPTVAFTDFWGGYHPSNNALGRRLVAPFAHTDSLRGADLVVHSFFGDQHLTCAGTRLSFSAEPTIPERTPAQYTIDWRHLPQPNHYRLPAWAAGIMDQPWLLDSATEGPPPDTRRFSNFIYKNPRCDVRNAFFEMLHGRRRVDALGRVFHNTDHPGLEDRGFANKRSVQIDYRFTIAFENSEHIGYTTEKLIDAWLADTVPIYWGNPAVAIDFPPDSYLSLYEAGSMARLVEQVLEVDDDPDLFERYRQANPFRTGVAAESLTSYTSGLEQFVARVAADVASQPTTRRRSRLAGARLRTQVAITQAIRRSRRAMTPKARS